MADRILRGGRVVGGENRIKFGKIMRKEPDGAAREDHKDYRRAGAQHLFDPRRLMGGKVRSIRPVFTIFCH